MGQIKFSVRAWRPGDARSLGAAVPAGICLAVEALVAAGRGVAYCLTEQDQPVGVATLTTDGEVMVYLHPTKQRHGYGTLALHSLIGRAEKAGYKRIHARARIGMGGEALGRKLGMEEVGRNSEEVFLERRFR